jgi:hypothetical protein
LIPSEGDGTLRFRECLARPIHLRPSSKSQVDRLLRGHGLHETGNVAGDLEVVVQIQVEEPAKSILRILEVAPGVEELTLGLRRELMGARDVELRYPARFQLGSRGLEET